jgi:hydrophobic/amphiphilic exporter-1 (mainly G- bacteria), HAE1 family
MIRQALSRPLAVLMVFTALVLLGGISFFLLPLDLLPEVRYPAVTVSVRLAGYSPAEIEQTLTKPMEAALASLNHLERLSSTSREGLAELRLSFEPGTPIDYVIQEVRERLQPLEARFPEDARTPLIAKYDPGAAPVLVISLSGSLDLVSLHLTGEEVVKRNLARVPGVVHTEVVGGEQLEVVIEPDLAGLRALGLSVLRLTEALKQSNIDVAAGFIRHQDLRLPLRSLGEFRRLEDIRRLGVLRTPSGSVVTLDQLAKVRFASQETDAISRYQGEPRVMLAVRREHGSHIVEVTQAVRRALAQLQPLLPHGVHTEVIYDQGEFILKALHRLRDAALLGGLCAVLVVWFFLRHLSSTLIIAAAIPISVLTTFGFMHLAGLSLNVISLAGLTLGVGMLVDNAIVVVENIYRCHRAGFPSPLAEERGAREVVQAVTAATLVHLAVFFPMFFFQKKVRLLYQDLCYTVSVALLVSLAVALVLVPVLAARFRPPGREARWFNGLARWHRRQLVGVLRHRRFWLSLALVLLILSLAGLQRLGFESTARVDLGEFTLMVQTPPATVPALTSRLVQQAEKTVMRQPEVKDVSTEIKGNGAHLRVRLVPSRERRVSTAALVERLRPAIHQIPFSLAHFQLERRGESDNIVSVEISGPEIPAMLGLAVDLRRRLSGLPQLRDAAIHLGNPAPEYEIRVDHRRAAYLGISAQDIAMGIRAALTGPLATPLRESGREMPLRTRLASQDRGSLGVLQQLTIPRVGADPSGPVQAPIWPAIEVRGSLSRFEIPRLDQRRAIELTAETRSLDVLSAAHLVQSVIRQTPRPPGYDIRLGHNLEELQETRREILLALALALALIYMIMAALFESFRTPLVIICSAPLALAGVAAALGLTGFPVSTAVYVGALALAGIVVSNAIVLVDHINHLRSRGRAFLPAVIRGTQDRLRPILITSATAILGLLPLALERQEGYQLWSPLAWTVIGGLVSATLLTLFILPAVYVMVMAPGGPSGPRPRTQGGSQAGDFEPQ